ncbi:MAG: Uma2 family endonuclease, partial [Candidatus Methylumidiphilus sp.]
MAAHAPKIYISESEYLAGERVSEVKHELIGGVAYAMAGAKKNHERIISALVRLFGNQLLDTPCDVYASDLKVKVAEDFFYPDIMVVCDDKTEHEYYTESPLLIVEVLSKSTRKTDETLKRLAYQSLPSLQEYVLIEQDFVDVEICRRSRQWQSEHYFLGDAA